MKNDCFLQNIHNIWSRRQTMIPYRYRYLPTGNARYEGAVHNNAAFILGKQLLDKRYQLIRKRRHRLRNRIRKHHQRCYCWISRWLCKTNPQRQPERSGSTSSKISNEPWAMGHEQFKSSLLIAHFSKQIIWIILKKNIYYDRKNKKYE